MPTPAWRVISSTTRRRLARAKRRAGRGDEPLAVAPRVAAQRARGSRRSSGQYADKRSVCSGCSARSIRGMRRALLARRLSLRSQRPAPRRRTTALVDVSVATLWKAPGLARPTGCALARRIPPTRARGAGTSRRQEGDRLWLDRHVQTQALYGQEVVGPRTARRLGEGRRGGRARSAGYARLPGVVAGEAARGRRARSRPGAAAIVESASSRPSQRRLEARAVVRDEAPVRARRRDAAQSSGTPRGGEATLPLRGGGGSCARRAIRRAHRSSRQRAVSWGIRYIWGGLSVFGFDCSGLVWAAYRSYGGDDSAPDRRSAVPRRCTGGANASSAPATCFFYGTQRYVHHVAIYAGDGQMLEAPGSAYRVRLVPVRWGEFAGARRL